MKFFTKILFALLITLSYRTEAQNIVDISYVPGCENAPVAINYVVNLGNDSIVNYDWDLDNDSQYDDAHLPIISYVFPGLGSFPVELRIITINNDTAYGNTSVTVNPVPIADFTVQEVCLNQNIHALDASIPNGSFIHKYEWSFDGITNLADTFTTTPTHFFSTEGLHDIQLKITTTAKCTAKVLKNVFVNPMPLSDFFVSNTCIGDSSLFLQNTTINSGGIVNFLWDFNGDGVYDDDQGHEADYMFFSTGNWPVALRSVSNAGCYHDTLKTIAIYPRPHASFIIDNNCQNQTLTINNISFTDIGALNYYWNFGNGDTSTAETPLYNYSVAGNYQIILKVNSLFNCVDSISKSIVIHPLPVVQFTASDVCLNQTNTFTNQSTSVESIKGYVWNFGDGIGSSSVNPHRTYVGSGIYKVTLKVETVNECIDSLSKNVEIFSLPKAHIFPSTEVMCDGDSVLLVGQDLAGKTYLWSNMAVGESIYVKESGEYELIVFDAHNCSAKDSIDIKMVPVPQFKFSADTTLELGTPVTLQADGFFDFSWTDANNNLLAQSPLLKITALESQTYFVTGKNDDGCSATFPIHVEVFKDYHLVANNLITPNNDGKNDIWKINYITAYPDCDVIVFNRWGEEVWRSVGGYHNDWGGVASNGFELPDATYYYVISCTGMKKEITGALTILRSRE